MNNQDDLIKFIKKHLNKKKFVVAIQREPYIHSKTLTGAVRVDKAAGGAHLLLDGILRKIGGSMVSIGSGDADKDVVDDKQRILIPPEEESYTLKRIFLRKKEMEGFYFGFANQTLWPLCHAVFIKPIFNKAWWEEYYNVNVKFANAIVEELDGRDGFVWINDYHLALVPQLLREKVSNITVGTFWHIPWPTYEIFRILPWRREILKGLLASDFIGFHRGYHAENFISSARRELEVLVDSEHGVMTYRNHHTKLASVPAGIDAEEIQLATNKIKDEEKNIVKQDFGFDYEYLAIGVDRVDYTKGIPERLHIIDRFLEKHPEFHKKFVYLSIAAPSRLKIPAYKAINREIIDLVDKINWKYEEGNWKPIRYVNNVVSREKIFAYYKASNICLVTSLDDGMNLVAKEFVICCKKEKAMLLLSKFTGAAFDLKSSFLINPYDTEGSAEALYEALTLSVAEKVKRNKDMKEKVRYNNIYRWGLKFIRNTV